LKRSGKNCWNNKVKQEFYLSFVYLNFMKAISTFIFFSFLWLTSLSQSLEGEWKGSFTYGNESYFSDFDIPVAISNSISLYFKLNKDSSYTIYSYSKGKDHKGKDTIVVCKVLYQRNAADSLYLEETEVLRPVKAEQACFQKMYLNIRRKNKSTVLEGTWKSEGECNNSGKIKFTKKDRS